MDRTLLKFITCVGCFLAVCDVAGDAVAHERDESDAVGESTQAVIRFEDLLRVSESAAARNSHWRVELDSWDGAEKAWDRASASLPLSARGLSSCAVPLRVARGKLREADELFRRAAVVADPSMAAELLTEHESLQHQARDGLEKTRQCYSVLRAQVSLPRYARPSPQYQTEFQGDKQRDPQSCRLLAEIVAIYREALDAPAVTESKAWKQLDGKIDQLFGGRSHRSLMMDCHCPVVTAKRHLESMALKMKIPAPNPESASHITLAVQQDRENVLQQLRGIENCVANHCGGGLSRDTSRDYGDGAAPGAVRAEEILTPEHRQLLFKLGAEMNVIAKEQSQSRDPGSEFVGGMAQWARDQLQFLAQEPGVPVRQMAQGIIDYLLNDNSRNHQALKGAAQHAVAEFRKNPARFLGENLPNVLPGPGEMLGGTKALRNIAQVEKAAGSLKQIASAERKFGKFYEGIIHNNQMFGSSTGPKCFAKNACFPTALAEADLFRTGGPLGNGQRVRIRGVYDAGTTDLQHTRAEIVQRLQSYGENYQPRHPASFTPEELREIQTGNPVEVTSPEAIQNILQREGDGSQGLVFVKYRDGRVAAGELSGHVFNAQNVRGAIEWIDHTLQPGADPLFTRNLVETWYFFPIQ